MMNVTDEKTKSRRLRIAAGATQVRARVAQLVWLVCLACALVLAAGALLIALDANQANALVDFVIRTATKIDLGVFDRQNGVFDFSGQNRQTKNAVINWGLAAVAWLVIGKVLSGVIRK